MKIGDMHLPHYDISMYEPSFLQKACNTRMAATRYQSLEEYQRVLQRDCAEEDAFYSSLHIGYSVFFRNSLTFAVLEHIVLPGLLRTARENRQREIRIWSAGCAVGQEPYSVAILMEELLEKGGRDIDYRIFATDACESQIVKAQTGHFTQDAINTVSMNRTHRWFVREGDRYRIDSKLRSNVYFSVFELLNTDSTRPPTSIFGDFDLVMCSNVLYYYAFEYRKKIMEKLAINIRHDGFLVTGEAERGFVKEDGYREVYEQAGVFKRKS